MPNKLYHQGIFPAVNKEKYLGNNRDNIVFRSGWELRFMRFCDINENILAWASETIKISYLSPEDNKIHTYYPDFIIKVKMQDGSIKTRIVEIKPLKETIPPIVSKKRKVKTLMYESALYKKNQAKWAAAREYCKNRNWDFIILTEKDLPK